MKGQFHSDMITREVKILTVFGQGHIANHLESLAMNDS